MNWQTEKGKDSWLQGKMESSPGHVLPCREIENADEKVGLSSTHSAVSASTRVEQRQDIPEHGTRKNKVRQHTSKHSLELV